MLIVERHRHTFVDEGTHHIRASYLILRSLYHAFGNNETVIAVKTHRTIDDPTEEVVEEVPSLS